MNIVSELFENILKINSTKSAKNVDLNKYLGLWYELYRLPNLFEFGCKNITAEYNLNDNGTIQVINKCDRFCFTDKIEGVAYVNCENNSILSVKFPIFLGFEVPGSYIILETGIIKNGKLISSENINHKFKQYDYSMVGDASKRFLWILSRTKHLENNYVQELLCRARNDFGYGSKINYVIDSNE